MKNVLVIPAKDGWAPSDSVIRMLRRRARAKGLISDWPSVAVLEDHDLLLDCSHVNGDEGTDIIAGKRKGKWIFMLDPGRQRL